MLAPTKRPDGCRNSKRELGVRGAVGLSVQKYLDDESIVTYRIEYSPECEDHFQVVRGAGQAIILDTVDEQLIHQPTVETRNRKLMRPNPLVPWEPHIGDLPMYYEVVDVPDTVMHIRALGIKDRNVS